MKDGILVEMENLELEDDAKIISSQNSDPDPVTLPSLEQNTAAIIELRQYSQEDNYLPRTENPLKLWASREQVYFLFRMLYKLSTNLYFFFIGVSQIVQIIKETFRCHSNFRS